MDDTRGWQFQRANYGRVLSCLLGGSMVMLSGLTGCSDHRISLAEFLEMEQTMQAGPTVVSEIPGTQSATTQPAELPQEAREAIDKHLGPYQVGPGDVLSVTLTSEDQAGLVPPVTVRVSREGDIELPVVEHVKVAGLELEDVEAVIQEAYVPKVYRSVVVHVETVTVDTTNVLVLGAVQAPGLVPLRRTERNLLFAIVSAGGASAMASGSVRLKRLRRPAEEVTLNLRDPEELTAALSLEPLEDGDMVTVEAATPNTIFVGGLVNAPGPRTFAPGVKMTLLQVIAASGGLRTDLTPREGTLIRRMPDGRDVQVKLDMDRLSVGKDPNITLAAGDILWIPHTIETRVQDWINRNVFFRMGATLTAGGNYNVSYSRYGTKYLNDTAAQRYGSGATDGTRTLQDQFDPFGFLMQPATALTPIPTGP